MTIEPLLAKLRARSEICGEEEAALRKAFSDFRDYPADKTFVRAGDQLRNATLLIEGLVCRYKDLPNGKRQICALHLSGDFVDLQGFSLKYLDHNLMTLGPCRVGIVPHERLLEITETMPHLTRVLWFSTNLDASIHREWELSLGRRTAVERVAHFLCEMRIRSAVVGLGDEDAYPLAITQTELAECLGLTAVHVNRTLRNLRERGLAEFRSGAVKIWNVKGLEKLALFEPDYLYLERRSR